MKRSVLVLLTVFTVQQIAAVGISLAVTQVEPIGVEPEVARTIEELLQTEFARIAVFRVVERGRLDARYFFSLKTGISLSLNYANLVSLDKALWQDNEISTVDRIQSVFLKAGVVLRF